MAAGINRKQVNEKMLVVDVYYDLLYIRGMCNIFGECQFSHRTQTNIDARSQFRETFGNDDDHPKPRELDRECILYHVTLDQNSLIVVACK